MNKDKDKDKEQVIEMARGLRYNQNKNQMQLIPEYPLEQIGKVMTKGALKYAPNNWRKGMPWSEVEGSLQRHLALYKSGEDFDKESGVYHMAHVAVNAMFLVDYYRSNSHFDDRYKPYLNQKKIVLDIDEVVCDWQGGYRKKTGHALPANYWDSQYNTGAELEILAEDKEFWLGLDCLRRPDFVPHAYVSSRSIPVEWTMQWLELNQLPCKPVIHVPWGASKVEKLQQLGAEIFIDDKFDNFADAMRAGINSFMMDASHNKFYDVGYRRIYDLKLRNIVR